MNLTVDLFLHAVCVRRVNLPTKSADMQVYFLLSVLTQLKISKTLNHILKKLAALFI